MDFRQVKKWAYPFLVAGFMVNFPLSATGFNFNGLPLEVLEKIFDYLPAGETSEKRFVSKEWDKFITTHLIFTKDYINQLNRQLEQGPEKIDVNKVINRGRRTLTGRNILLKQVILQEDRKPSLLNFSQKNIQKELFIRLKFLDETKDCDWHFALTYDDFFSEDKGELPSNINNIKLIDPVERYEDQVKDFIHQYILSHFEDIPIDILKIADLLRIDKKLWEDFPHTKQSENVFLQNIIFISSDSNLLLKIVGLCEAKNFSLEAYLAYQKAISSSKDGKQSLTLALKFEKEGEAYLAEQAYEKVLQLVKNYEEGWNTWYLEDILNIVLTLEKPLFEYRLYEAALNRPVSIYSLIEISKNLKKIRSPVLEKEG